MKLNYVEVYVCCMCVCGGGGGGYNFTLDNKIVYLLLKNYPVSWDLSL